MHDHMRKGRRGLTLATALLLMGALTGPAWAVDGVIEINQARAMKGGVTPGDEPGFPVTIGLAGSYRLTGNLTVPDANTTAIHITVEDVTVDLNGFAIVGPGAAGTGRGIDTLVISPPFFSSLKGGITVVNGTIRGMGGDGVIVGPWSRVEKLHARNNGGNGVSDGGNSVVSGNTVGSNGAAGIRSNEGSLVSGNTATSNLGDGITSVNGRITVTGNTVLHNEGKGIDAGEASTVAGNMASFNLKDGISVFSGLVSGNTVNRNQFGANGISALGDSTVRGNTVSGNLGVGLVLGPHAGYANNVVSGNSGGEVSGGIQIGPNVCGTALCP